MPLLALILEYLILMELKYVITDNLLQQLLLTDSGKSTQKSPEVPTAETPLVGQESESVSLLGSLLETQSSPLSFTVDTPDHESSVARHFRVIYGTTGISD